MLKGDKLIELTKAFSSLSKKKQDLLLKEISETSQSPKLGANSFPVTQDQAARRH